MAVQQYLPFVLREFVVARLDPTPPGGVPPPTKTIFRVSSSEIGFEKPVHLGDLSVAAVSLTEDISQASRLMMRVGWRGRGYILERPIQIGAWMNQGRPLTNCWRLEKPYYLAANGTLQAITQARSVSEDGLGWFRGIVFHGTREDNGKPYYLYESTDVAISSAATPTVGFRKQHLKAPPDTGLFIHAVAIPDYDMTGIGLINDSLRIISPNGYEWIKVSDRSDLAAIVPLYHQQWLGTPSSMFELGSERGWIIQPKEALLLEFENKSDTPVGLGITLRGSVEV